MTKKILQGLAGFAAIATPLLTVIACGSKDEVKIGMEKEVSDVIKAYDKEVATIAKNSYGNLTKDNSDKIKAVVIKYENKAKELKNKIGANLYKEDAGVWIETFTYQLGIVKQGLDVNVRYLGGDPTKSAYPLSHFYNKVWDNAPSNPKKLKDYIDYIKTLKSNLTEGMNKGITFSGVYFRLLYSDIVKFFGEGDFPTDSSKWNQPYKGSVENLFNNGKGFVGIYEKVNKDEAATSDYKAEVKELVINTIREVNGFIKFLKNDYWPKIKYGGNDGSTWTTKNPETRKPMENHNVLKGTGVKLSQYGLTQNDLDVDNIGYSDMGEDGKKLYQFYLNLSTSTTKTAKTIHDEGTKATKQNITQMTKIGKLVASKRKTGESWKPEAFYDKDINDLTLPEKRDFNILDSGNYTHTEFNKWLNSEQWFYGRDKITKAEADKMETTSDKKTNIKTILKEQGYENWLNDANKSKPTKANTKRVTQEQAYNGAIDSLYSYYEFQKSSSAVIKKWFKNVDKDYKIKPYMFKDKDSSGVGAYSGSQATFWNNVDPYYGLQKWSLSSLSLHEAIPGHHFQAWYYNENKHKLAPSFSYTAFAEGWGLFSEWFGVTKGIYGNPNIDKTTGLMNNELPKFSENAKGVITEQNATKFHKGVYKDYEQANAIQYYGYLNEQQLRAMRLAVDTGIHSKGWSLKKVRKYMGDNSALGQGDINSESKRYLSYVGQATSYYTGKNVMMDLYKKYYLQEAAKNNKEFTEEKSKLYFSYVLKNNDLPLKVLENYVTKNLID